MPVRYRVLAVDDNPDTLELIRLALSDEYDVLTLGSPLEIYECIELFEPDLLILDIMMPKITGFQLLELLKKNARTKDLPIIVLSAKDNIREIKHGYKLGAALYLTKPFQPDRLLQNTGAQFRMHPPALRPKSLTMEQVRIQVEMRQSAKTGQIVVSSSLLTRDNITRKPKSQTPGAAPEAEPEAPVGSVPSPEPEENSGPHWQG
jgi:DNA-binding response OmpR family regulator